MVIFFISFGYGWTKIRFFWKRILQQKKVNIISTKVLLVSKEG
ncbi:hypothetical protein BACCELL_01090 [Bacteroides cellulosilyticus DSM 14838]|uniref:Uncharacterized protein n=1 Tax=Bacteroides cellulosilyticus DSM 14838 TaxID=537012 RepID=E2N9Z1_9BACE|nr:hypothetical protein BACCELL_01090 [Bacteroides cellulosilyticus DSM 14838]